MGYKLIACDLDETLLNDDHLVGKKNHDAILKARKEYGVKFVPATGRGFMQIQSELEELELNDLKGEYVISFNGGALSENKGNRIIEFNGLPFEKMKEIFEIGLSFDVCQHIYTADKLYVFNLSESEKKRLAHLKLDVIYPKENNVDFLKDIPIAKILYQNIDVPYLMSLEDELKSITDDCVAVSYSSNRYMEFNAVGVDKGQGLIDLANKLGIDIEDTIAVGDNYNDLSMLKVAGLAVGANNAVDDVKVVCDYVTQANNNEGVVAELIERFIFNEI
ncbi:MAG: Cof-type HAD-IIB family hydrolase [Thomasclavelia sp.]|uniref:Cof-type HAD-IIB family hydrolase n=1 Tax=Thomasclavelia sp. TaxID=3025757 RepID=UPI0039A08DBF